MIPESKLQEIKSFLLKSQNPLFFFDDDPDGLCSYIILRRLIDRGRGIAVKGKPMISVEYVKKVREYHPDFVFILDKPIVDQEFIDAVSVPIIWLDHHPIKQRQGVRYYNPLNYDKNDSRPTSFWAYKIAGTSLLFGTLGPIADYYIPPYTKEFFDKYPGLLPKNLKKIQDILYNSRFGELVKIVSFCIKGKTSDIAKLINILLKIEDPYEILDATTPRGKFVQKHAYNILKEYDHIKQKAIESFNSQKTKVIFYIYPSKKFSLTSELSSELQYLFPHNITVLGRQKDDEIKLSIRSTSLKIDTALKKALGGVSGYGGGHPYACGANIKSSDLKKFLEQLKAAL